MDSNADQIIYICLHPHEKCKKTESKRERNGYYNFVYRYLFAFFDGISVDQDSIENVIITHPVHFHC